MEDSAILMGVMDEVKHKRNVKAGLSQPLIEKVTKEIKERDSTKSCGEMMLYMMSSQVQYHGDWSDELDHNLKGKLGDSKYSGVSKKVDAMANMESYLWYASGKAIHVSRTIPFKLPLRSFSHLSSNFIPGSAVVMRRSTSGTNATSC